eukprot:gb/GECH01012058.1/.p1 GENE.gb/GECH01012058.1/~~gb/GECH01012058.1/.p1  ORF type:complete len:374 (+),score=112.07 gb/GECH01012058.1/:1-1122(+)
MSKKRGYVSEKYVELSLSSLYFPEPHDRNITDQLVLSNISDATVAFKIKTTQPKRYTVKPRAGFIDRGDTQDIKISMHPLAEGEKIGHDKFLVETAIVSEREQNESKDVLWKQLEAAKEHRVAGTKLSCEHSGQTPDDVMVVVMNDGSVVVSSKGEQRLGSSDQISEEEDVASYGWMTSRGKDQDEEEAEHVPSKPEQPSAPLQDEAPEKEKASAAPGDGPGPRATDVSEERGYPNATDPAQHPSGAAAPDTTATTSGGHDEALTESAPQEQLPESFKQVQETLNQVRTENKELSSQLKSRDTIIQTLRTAVQSCETKISEQDKKLKEKDKKLSMRRKTRSSSTAKETPPEQTMNIKLIIIAAIIAFIIGKLL